MVFLSVALLAEGVDRNIIANRTARKDISSPSSRRAWIEMIYVLNVQNGSQ